MMNSLSTFAGGLIIAGVAWAATNPLFVEQPFMRVESIRYEAGMIYTHRTINVQRTVADWRVTIVGENRDAPFCQTKAGDGIDEGWSIYSEDSKARAQMPLDVWVGDVGCADRLTPGKYTMFTTWTPRDGTDPVYQTTEFERK